MSSINGNYSINSNKINSNSAFGSLESKYNKIGFLKDSATKLNSSMRIVLDLISKISNSNAMHIFTKVNKKFIMASTFLAFASASYLTFGVGGLSILIAGRGMYMFLNSVKSESKGLEGFNTSYSKIRLGIKELFKSFIPAAVIAAGGPIGVTMIAFGFYYSSILRDSDIDEDSSSQNYKKSIDEVKNKFSISFSKQAEILSKFVEGKSSAKNTAEDISELNLDRSLTVFDKICGIKTSKLEIKSKMKEASEKASSYDPSFDYGSSVDDGFTIKEGTSVDRIDFTNKDDVFDYGSSVDDGSTLNDGTSSDRIDFTNKDDVFDYGSSVDDGSTLNAGTSVDDQDISDNDPVKDNVYSVNDFATTEKSLGDNRASIDYPSFEKDGTSSDRIDFTNKDDVFDYGSSVDDGSTLNDGTSLDRIDFTNKDDMFNYGSSVDDGSTLNAGTSVDDQDISDNDSPEDYYEDEFGID